MGSTILFLFAGIEMYWEEMAMYMNLHMVQPHNLKKMLRDQTFQDDITANKDYYYVLDGVGIFGGPSGAPGTINNAWNIHVPPHNIVFSETAPRLMTGELTRSKPVRKVEWGLGYGMSENAKQALNVLIYLTKRLEVLGDRIEKIYITGFSRGGVTCVVAANYITQYFKGKTPKIDMFMIDPVPGPMQPTR